MSSEINNRLLFFLTMSGNGVRDLTPNRSYGNGSSPTAVSIVELPDAANANFTPAPGAIYSMIPTAGRALTVVAASMTALSNLSVGEGFQFWVHNDSAGANAITLTAGGAPNVDTYRTSLLVVAQGETGHFSIFRHADGLYKLVSLGIATH